MPHEAPAPDGPRVQFEGERGAPVLLQYARREMTIYALNESEIRSISFMNALAMAFFSLASASCTFALGVLVEGAFQESLTAEAAVLNEVVSPVCVVFTIIFAGLGIWALVHRGSMLNTVRSESHVESRNGGS